MNQKKYSRNTAYQITTTKMNTEINMVETRGRLEIHTWIFKKNKVKKTLGRRTQIESEMK